MAASKEAAETQPRCCFFGRKVGISSLENRVSSVQWPSLTKRQREEKVREPRVSVLLILKNKAKNSSEQIITDYQHLDSNVLICQV